MKKEKYYTLTHGNSVLFSNNQKNGNGNIALIMKQVLFNRARYIAEPGYIYFTFCQVNQEGTGTCGKYGKNYHGHTNL